MSTIDDFNWPVHQAAAMEDCNQFNYDGASDLAIDLLALAGYDPDEEDLTEFNHIQLAQTYLGFAFQHAPRLMDVIVGVERKSDEPTTEQLLEQLRYALNYHGNPDNNTVSDLIHTLDRRIQGADE